MYVSSCSSTIPKEFAEKLRHERLSASKAIRRLLALVLIFALHLGVRSAEAGVVFEIQRRSDSEVLITATGSLLAIGTPQFALDYLTMNPVIAPAIMSLSAFSGDLAIGGHGVELIGVPGLANLFTLAFDGVLDVGDSASGTLLVNLNPGVEWAPIGTTGHVIWGIGNDIQFVGTYAVVTARNAVPEPHVGALLALGLAGVLRVRFRPNCFGLESIGQPQPTLTATTGD